MFPVHQENAQYIHAANVVTLALGPFRSGWTLAACMRLVRTRASTCQLFPEQFDWSLFELEFSTVRNTSTGKTKMQLTI